MVIGVTGKSGSGKSTISKYIESNLKDAKVIHVDHLHKKYLLTEKKEHLIALYGKDIIVDGELNTNLFIQYPEKQNQVFEESYEDLEELIEKEIIASQDQYEHFIIDFFRLLLLKNIWDSCDYHILVEAASEEKRFENIVARYRRKGQEVKRSKEEEKGLRDFNLPDYYSYTYDLEIINHYNEESLKQVKPLIKKIEEGRK